MEQFFGGVGIVVMLFMFVLGTSVSVTGHYLFADEWTCTKSQKVAIDEYKCVEYSYVCSNPSVSRYCPSKKGE